jgi:opacity protein-like surface antigen
MGRVMFKLTVLLLVCAALLAPGQTFAGRSDKAGTSAAPELLIPVGARYLGLAGSPLAIASGVEAIYWNPAGLARSQYGAEAIFSHMNYIADIGVEYVAIGTAIEGFGSIGFDLKALSLGDFEITTEDVPDGTGQIFNPTYVTLGLTYSRLLTDRISVGVTGNLISERIDRVSATGFAFSFGVQYTDFASVNGLAIGVAVKNIGPGMQFDGSGLLREAEITDNLRPPSPLKIDAATDELPSIIELGVAYQYRFDEQNNLTGSALFQNQNMSDDEYKFGAEYAFDNMLFFRAGYAFSQETRTDSHIYGLTLGAGIQYNFGTVALGFDYAYRDVDFFDANHVFALKIGF